MIEKQSKIAVASSNIDAGKPVDAYTLSAGPYRMRVLTLGGTITHLLAPGRDGKAGDVVLGFDDVARYEKQGPYFGSLIGRVANRTSHGRFSLDNVSYSVTLNEPPHHLHGGAVGYDKRVWTAQAIDGESPSVRLTLRDPDGHEGYAGNVDVVATYTLTPDGVVRIAYEATTDAATPINLTNHTYFNLKDAGASRIDDHALQVDASGYTPVDATLMPTGEVAPVAGTPFDFRAAKPIGRDVRSTGRTPVGFDHNYVIDGADGTLRRCARVVEPTSGRTFECWTTEPAVQLYTGNFLDGTRVGKGGLAYQQHTGFCLETQHYPNSANVPAFPNTILRPGERFRSTTEYRFGAE